MRHWSATPLLLVLGISLAGSGAFGRVITVPRDYSTIQAAIDAAANGDEIVVLSWTYRENINFGGKNIVVRSTDPTSSAVIASTIIQAAQPGSVVTFSGAESPACILSGFTITKGGDGGILGNGTHATIQNNVITSNTAWYSAGGGLYMCDGLIQFNTITNNGAKAGGGLYGCHGTIRCNTIAHNTAHGDQHYGAQGGGLANCSGLIANNVIAFNSTSAGYSALGGGLYDCNGTLLNNTIYGNSATQVWGYGQGGGLFSCDGFIANCIIWGNTVFGGVPDQLVGCVPPLYCCIQDWPANGTTNMASDPRFVDPANGNFHLQPNSPCIDRGQTDYLAGTYLADMDGECRLAGQSVDMGCDETGSSKDRDGDLLPDKDEGTYNTDWNNPDTDGDGLLDGIEVLRGSVPNVFDPPLGLSVWPQSGMSIQKAIFWAFPAEVITVRSGTYVENLSFLGKNLTLQSTKPFDKMVVETTVISGGMQAPVIFLAGSDQTCAVRGFTIRNGFGLSGGCIKGGGTSATIENNRITGGRAEIGGGLSGCNGTIRGNTITSNTAQEDGGGLFDCNGTIENNAIMSNSASDEGGGLYGCNGTIRDNVVIGNSAAWGGGLYGCDGPISNNTISSNTVILQGGGLHNCNGIISGNTISYNRAIDGGGLFWLSATVENNLIAGNHASGVGGGLGQCGGLIRNNIVSYNTAGDGGGLDACYGTIRGNRIAANTAYMGGGLAWCSALIQSNLIYENASNYYGGGLLGCSGRVENNTIFANQAKESGGGIHRCDHVRNSIVWGNSAAANLQVSDSTIPSYCCIEGWPLGGTGNITASPQLADPAAGDFHLLADSPCIDAGGAVDGLNEDFDGDWRPYDAVAEPRGDGSGYDIGADEYLGLAGMPDLRFASVDFGPAAPTQLQPGAPVALGAFLENTGGTPASPFWLEFWGSRTGGLTLDQFLADSVYVPGIPGAGSFSFAQSRFLYGVPDGPYTVVFTADRPREVRESDETNNRAIVRGKRLLVIRPQTQVDLVVENFSLSPTLLQSGQAVRFDGQVRNAGTQDSGPFWIEFWASMPYPYPELFSYLCDSIFVPSLSAGATIQLSASERMLYALSLDTFWVGCYADRPDAINELDETNNYQFLPYYRRMGGRIEINAASGSGDNPILLPDIAVTALDFSPYAPTPLKPGDIIGLSVTVENRGAIANNPIWLEFWGSTLGGLSPSVLLLDLSERLPALAPGERRTLTLQKPLLGVPDGPYTMVAFVDRLCEGGDMDWANNRFAVAGKRLLVVRPPTGANLTLEGFVVPGQVVPGESLRVSGTVRNSGTADSGGHWIEFWGARDPAYPALDFILCYSIPVVNLAPGQSLDLSKYTLTIYPNVPATGIHSVGCFVDRVDQVNETDESDNYTFRPLGH